VQAAAASLTSAACPLGDPTIRESCGVLRYESKAPD
jgi:hypothetical protein